MPWPRAVARLNKRYTNRLIEPLVSRLPGFIVVHHHGRRTGTPYATPLYSFATADGVVVALTYGVSADWAQNVLTSGGTIERNGDMTRIADAVVVERTWATPHIPVAVRAALRVLRVSDFMHLKLA